MDEFEPQDLSEGERDELRALEPEVANLTTWEPPGPTSQAYLNDASLTAFLMGPVGQGKTTTMCLKRVHDGAGQGLGRDGWVRDRALILRKTWRTAKGTVVRSWREWFPTNYPGGTWTGGEDRPATHTLRFQDTSRAGSLNPVKIEMETDFKGLDDTSIDEILKGAEYSRIILDESDQFSLNVLETCEERVGRYPRLGDLADGEKRTRQVLGAFNAPDKNNYLHDTLVAHPVMNRKLYTAPAGLLVDWAADGQIVRARVNPEAENLHRLDADYYTAKAQTWEDWRLRRFVLNEWGYSRDGLPVFVSDFREHLHVAKQMIAPNPNLPLIIGADGSTAGLRPAGVFLQPDGAGFLNVIMSVVPEGRCGAARFWEMMKETQDVFFRGCTEVEIWADPASQYGGDSEGGQLSFHEFGLDIMKRPIRIPFGGSNEVGLRLDTVRAELRRVVQGDARGLRISPHPTNKHGINGMASGYRYQKRPGGLPGAEWDDKPDKKNGYSDWQDALQYAIGGWRRIQGARSLGRDKGGDRRVQSGWTQRRDDFDVHKM
jgi:hypothetical protein